MMAKRTRRSSAGPARPKRRRAKAHQRAHVDGFEHRVHGDPVAVAHTMVEADRRVVHEDDIDLRVRHAQRSDHVPDGGSAFEGMLEGDGEVATGME